MRLVLDWDGTVTERDTLDLVLQEFGDPEIYEHVESELEASVRRALERDPERLLLTHGGPRPRSELQL